MAAPSIAWYRLTGTTTGPTYSAIDSLDFGTITAGAWGYVQCIVPKVTNNSIQSCKWWMYDVEAQRSGAPVSVGTAGGFTHRMTATDTYVKPSGISASATWGTESPESTGSGYSYPAVTINTYGDFVLLALKVASAASDGAHTAWGYQLKYSYT